MLHKFVYNAINKYFQYLGTVYTLSADSVSIRLFINMALYYLIISHFLNSTRWSKVVDYIYLPKMTIKNQLHSYATLVFRQARIVYSSIPDISKCAVQSLRVKELGRDIFLSQFARCCDNEEVTTTDWRMPLHWRCIA